MEEKGMLIIGVNYEGKIYRDFSVRPKKVKDTLSFIEEDEKALENEKYLGALSVAKQLKIPGIPKKAITPDFILEMYDEDAAQVLDAVGRLEKKIAVFRKKANAPEDDDPGGQENGVP
ncbi:MAG: hypothetical protein L3J69_06120 [Desulfobacula sp.]|nr:hypothetical protein [Desulfobacula sp.]